MDAFKKLHLDLICLNDRSFSEWNLKAFIITCHTSVLLEGEELHFSKTRMITSSRAELF